MKFLIYTLFLSSLLFARGSLDSAAFCSSLNQCIKSTPKWCTADLKKANPEIRYDIDFCDDIIQFNGEKIKPDSNSGTKQLYSLLGKRYRMEYPISGLLPVNMKMMIFLIENLEFTTLLINAYEDTKYSANYINHKRTRFKGSNGGSLSGKFEFLKQNNAEGVYSIVGEGFAQVLTWRLKGDAVMMLDFDALSDREIAYDIKCMAFPGNSVINKIMELEFFEKKVLEFINEIVADISGTAYRFADGDRKPIKNYKPLQTKRSQELLKEFEKVIKDSKYSN